MQHQQTWRELLEIIIKDPRERQRLAEALGVHPVTLSRWASGDSEPRIHNLQALVEALPRLRTQLTTLIQKEFRDFGVEATNTDNLTIPAEFYARVLTAHAQTPSSLRQQTLCGLILYQALGQLDPHKLGLSITIVQCMPPHPTGHIYSIRESVGVGTPPWRTYVEPKSLFLGSESLAGYAVTTGHVALVQDMHDSLSFFPALQTNWEESAVACPILRSSRVAGCLLVSSTVPNYFSSGQIALIQSYADLLVLLFEPDEFYDLEMIDLRAMPDQQVQQTLFATYRQRIALLLHVAAKQGKSLSNAQAEHLALQELEEALLQFPPQEETTQGPETE